MIAIAPYEELTGLLMVTSEPAPVDINVTVPLVAALIAPLTITDPNDAVSDTRPAAFVVMAPTVRLPVANVKVKFKLLAVTVARFMLDTLGVSVYATIPIPESAVIVCVVFALAVTVSVDNIPVVAACFNVI